MPTGTGAACACGCGSLAKPGNRYVNGHNGRGRPRPDSVREAVRAAMTGERNHRYGTTPHNFKGRITTNFGYVMVWRPDHPFAQRSGRIQEHRVVLEEHLRAVDPTSVHLVEVEGVRYLRPDVEVHHLDHDKANNHPGNLLPMSKSDHAAFHANLRQVR